MGISPRQYLAAKRFGNFRTRIKEGESVTNALYDSGFNSSSRLYERASDELGMTPATYGRSGRGVHIKYTIVDSPLGRLLVAVTERGVCSVTMGDRDIQLENTLKSEFSEANIERTDSALRKTVAAILNHLSFNRAAPRFATGYSRNGVSATGVGEAAYHSCWTDHVVRSGCEVTGESRCRASCWPSLLPQTRLPS
jgi:AraC family transcriptional regulator of adaptative response/methylated-DNA-[protein]-cysteine methyltransferase